MEVNHSLFIAAEICDQKRNGAGLVRSVTGTGTDQPRESEHHGNRTQIEHFVKSQRKWGRNTQKGRMGFGDLCKVHRKI